MEVRQVQQDLQETEGGNTMDVFCCVPIRFWKAVLSSGKHPLFDRFEGNEELCWTKQPW